MSKYPAPLGSRLRPDSALAAQFAAAAKKLREEREHAAATIDRLLAETPQACWPALAETPGLQNCGALERLGQLFTASINGDPRYAMNLAQLGVAAAEALPADAYAPVIGAQVRAHAWKDLGKALGFLSRNEDALLAFARAEAFVTPFGTLVYDRAIIRFNLAVTLQELGRFNESLALLTECKEVFRAHGDTTNVLRLGVAEGTLLHRLKYYREARETYRQLLFSMRDISKETRAAIHQAIGFCCVDLDDFDEAEKNIDRAVALYTEIHHPLNIAKVEFARGRLLVRRGDYPAAINHLRPLRQQFLDNNMPEEAGLCGLEIVEAMLHLDRAAEARSLATTIAGEFTAASLSARALTALTYAQLPQS